jgi:hypothetical protein
MPCEERAVATIWSMPTVLLKSHVFDPARGGPLPNSAALTVIDTGAWASQAALCRDAAAKAERTRPIAGRCPPMRQVRSPTW